jgi:hypothetical protein
MTLLSCPAFVAGLLLSVLSLPVRAQNVAPGRVTTTAGEPVPYASVGVVGKPIGTIADAGGTFSLSPLASAAPTDTVVVSCVGYQAQKLLLAQLRRQTLVSLTPAATPLREVLVRAKSPKRTILGHKGRSIFTSFNFYTSKDSQPHDRLGREVGLLLAVKRPAHLESFHLFVFNNDFTTVKFRLNIYAVKDGRPQTSLLTKDVLFEVTGGKPGWCEVDLRPYAIELAGQQQVVASVQWLQSQTNNPASKHFGISTDLSPFHTTFLRDKSQETWRRFGANSSFYFTALTYPE